MVSTDLERLSSTYDGEQLPQGRLSALGDPAMQGHLHNWSIIGGVMRGEIKGQIDLGFAARVAARVAEIEPDIVEDQSRLAPSRKLRVRMHRLAQGLVQLGVAASVAVVTVLGYQTYSASDSSITEPASAVMGASVGVNLASFQAAAPDRGVAQVAPAAPEGKDRRQLRDSGELQQVEFDRINNYVRGFVLDTAAR
ncbi:MAG: hypothetical protein K6A65_05510 [Succinivibrionaceae bacterium]|nr:hypothetical protein [Succinivibrionaceae bacterium]